MADGMAGEEGRGTSAPPGDVVPLSRGLSTKLLILTILFVMLAEVLIFLPSVANFRIQWLAQRLSTSAAVSIVLMEGEPGSLSQSVQDEVLTAIGVRAIAFRDEGVSQLLVVAEMPPEVDQHVDIVNTGPHTAIGDALETLFFGGDRTLRVFGPVGDSATEFEILISDEPLRGAMLIYSRNVAILSLIISLITAMLVFYAINRMMIRPVRSMTRSMLAFAEAPDDASRIIRPAGRQDELGVAERELAAMQENLHRTLGEQKHLADLGLAVSKINHDMRNILASAQLMSDRLRQVKDPTVQSFAPKLLRTLDRAVAYTEGVLSYGRAQEAPPARRRVMLRLLVDDVHGLLGLDTSLGIDFVNAVDAELEIDADAEQLFRVLINLSRNSIQAMSSDSETAVVKRLTVSAERTGSVCRILVCDTGPGMPRKARENLFAAFRGSARSGGTGLGLAIAHELVRAHGGNIELVESKGGSTIFAIVIPDQPVRLDEARTSLRRPA